MTRIKSKGHTITAEKIDGTNDGNVIHEFNGVKTTMWPGLGWKQCLSFIKLLNNGLINGVDITTPEFIKKFSYQG